MSKFLYVAAPDASEFVFEALTEAQRVGVMRAVPFTNRAGLLKMVSSKVASSVVVLADVSDDELFVLAELEDTIIERGGTPPKVLTELLDRTKMPTTAPEWDAKIDGVAALPSRCRAAGEMP